MDPSKRIPCVEIPPHGMRTRIKRVFGTTIKTSEKTSITGSCWEFYLSLVVLWVAHQNGTIVPYSKRQTYLSYSYRSRDIGLNPSVVSVLRHKKGVAFATPTRTMVNTTTMLQSVVQLCE
jgi:hypothetical protein